MNAAANADRVAAVVLNHKRADDTIACVESLRGLNTPPGAIELIDNASSDDSVARLRATLPDLPLTVNPRNLGFGGGQNEVIQRLMDDEFEWIWLLNNDARAAPDTLEGLLKRARDKRVGAVGALLRDLEPPRGVQAVGGGHVIWWRGSSREWRGERNRPLDYITGACMLLRAEALRQIGLFDPRFFMYWEDVDLCLRMRRAGWTLAVAEDAVIFHRQSTSTDSTTKDRLINASTTRFFRKHAPLGGWPAILIGTAARIARRLATGRPAHARAVLQGVRDGLKNELP
ncbi:MAG: glycosyltransferase family 2 protein [Wenzhouxiangellaceae bacterium]